MQMGTQSADVERVCKAHKIVHSRGRIRLLSERVQQLLYCYVNLRLLNRYRVTKGATPTAAAQAEMELENFLDQAIFAEEFWFWK